MPKDLQFESDRFLKRQSAKRWLLWAAALVAVIAAAVALALILRAQRGEPRTGDPDALYPYSWTENRDGSLTLSIRKEGAEGYVWRTGDVPAGLTAQMEDAAAAETAQLSVTALKAGRSVLDLILEREGDGSEQLARMSLLLEAQQGEEKLSLQLLGASDRRAQGTVSGGEGSAYPYSFETDPEGDLLLVIRGGAVPVETEPPEGWISMERFEAMAVEAMRAEQEAALAEAGITLHARTATAGEAGSPESAYTGDETYTAVPEWDCVSDNPEAAEVLGLTVRGADVTVYIRPGTPGKANIRAYSDIGGAEISAECETTGEGTLLVLTHAITAG